jgi:DNA (cytosine-5)-methyltransferase 1
MRHGSLFSGIGGFDLAAEWMGWDNVFHCEWNPFGQKILHHYWPNAIQYNDITKTDFSVHRGTIDILTGGFPCQPYSMAGKRLGKEDERHLWPHMLRAIREIRPRWVVGENVLGIANWNGGLVFDEVQADLEAEGYEVQPYVLPAVAVDAPHRRDRVWFVAYLQSNGCTLRQTIDKLGKQNQNHGDEIRDIFIANGELRNAADSCNTRLQGGEVERGITSKEGKREQYRNITRQISIGWENFPTQSPICGRDDGIPDRLDGITFPKWRNESIKGYGNAVVPQVVHQIFKAIGLYESTSHETNNPGVL